MPSRTVHSEITLCHSPVKSTFLFPCFIFYSCSDLFRSIPAYDVRRRQRTWQNTTSLSRFMKRTFCSVLSYSVAGHILFVEPFLFEPFCRTLICLVDIVDLRFFPADIQADHAIVMNLVKCLKEEIPADFTFSRG